MDGASYFTIYSRILLPLLKPAIVTCLILKGVGIYNEYYSANLYLQDKQKLGTVAISLYAFTGPQGSKYNGPDRLPDLPEADLQRRCGGCREGIILRTYN